VHGGEQRKGSVIVVSPSGVTVIKFVLQIRLIRQGERAGQIPVRIQRLWFCFLSIKSPIVLSSKQIVNCLHAGNFFVTKF
jgi:hypothetical protein